MQLNAARWGCLLLVAVLPAQAGLYLPPPTTSVTCQRDGSGDTFHFQWAAQNGALIFMFEDDSEDQCSREDTKCQLEGAELKVYGADYDFFYDTATRHFRESSGAGDYSGSCHDG